MLPEGTDDLVRRTLLEDIGDGDHTALSTIPSTERGAARLLVKQEGVLAGVELAGSICEHFDPALKLRVLIQDGAAVRIGDIAFTMTGPARSIVTVERTVLNFMQRMSGIATLTRKFVDALDGTGCKVLDTRKTTPTLRAMEKWAVRIGGGQNHRHGLYDMVMIKDNHADFAGGIPAAVKACQRYLADNGLQVPIEVETRNLKEVATALTCTGIHRIMLDNFGFDDLRKAVQLINNACQTEASGGITLANARRYAETGVDCISVGALTHSAGSLDLSLKAMI